MLQETHRYAPRGLKNGKQIAARRIHDPLSTNVRSIRSAWWLTGKLPLIFGKEWHLNSDFFFINNSY